MGQVFVQRQTREREVIMKEMRYYPTTMQEGKGRQMSLEWERERIGTVNE